MKFWKTFLLVSIPYGILMFLFQLSTQQEFTNRDAVGVLLKALLFGLFFTLVTRWMSNWQLKRIIIEVHENEKIIKEGAATLSGEGRPKSGKLALTDQHIIFKSNKIGNDVFEQSFPLSEIKSIQETATFLRNILYVNMQDGTAKKFIVFDSKEWVRAIGHK
jgi:hypothetical protein